MLGRAEYVALSAELQNLIRSYQLQAEAELVDVTDPQVRADKIRTLYKDFMNAYKTFLQGGLDEVANNAADHYGADDVRQTAEDLVRTHFSENYYGATLNQRLAVYDKRIQRAVTVAKGVNPEKMSTDPLVNVLSQQTYTLQRLLLGSIVKVEQNAAVAIADEKGERFIRWVLSPRHSRTCECEELANNVDKAVVTYLKNRNLNVNPKGLYFTEELPHPPHPNCQCGFLITGARGAGSGTIKRTLGKIRSLLRRIRGR